MSQSASPITQRVQSSSSSSIDTRGKHRIQAEVKRLEQEARFLEEELEQLDKLDKASTKCKEMLSNVETRPDPLLPLLGDCDMMIIATLEILTPILICCLPEVSST
ncbi:guanine nucleotide-binding protein subunit gamma 2-like [Cucumis melo var. makuwa]|uniref:Guanine nucleotide-binding protein subunit gamma 2-like n=2 Tax=Cucumis melo TaxID=3656 RepID=A0A5A7UVC9_CUCMM|nr:guanine nucleotide-binding protein subunit gamma 2-like [Cucumis melo var. makuwa]